MRYGVAAKVKEAIAHNNRIISTIGILQDALLLAIGIRNITTGRMAVGIFMAFFMAVRRMKGYISQLAGCLTVYTQVRAIKLSPTLCRAICERVVHCLNPTPRPWD